MNWVFQMKIYTKTGDKGTTSLLNGERVPKDDALVEAYGTVDELNALLGITRSFLEDKKIVEIVLHIQHDLFTIGAELNALDSDRSVPFICEQHVLDLEQCIDAFEEHLPPQRSFILPGGSHACAFLQLARTVARRAERQIVAVAKKRTVRLELLSYMNRVSDLLHVLSRAASGGKEIAPQYRYFEKATVKK